MDKNSMTIAKESSNHEIFADPIGADIPQKSNILNQIQKEKNISEINDLKSKNESKIN